MRGVHCTLRPVVGEPPMIYGYRDRAFWSPDIVYCLNEQGHIMRSAPQRYMTMAEMAAMDEAAEQCAKAYRVAKCIG